MKVRVSVAKEKRDLQMFRGRSDAHVESLKWAMKRGELVRSRRVEKESEGERKGRPTRLEIDYFDALLDEDERETIPPERNPKR